MRLLCALLCLTFGLLVSGCGGPTGEAGGKSARSNKPDAGLVVLRRGNGAEPDTLDPQKAQGTWEVNVIGDMIIGLTTEGPDGEPIPGAAESWTTSADGLVWTFKMRKGMNWSDGVPVTANDFVYSLRRILDPKTAAQYASLLYVIKNAEKVNSGEVPGSALGARAIDPETLEITLAHPAPYFLEIAKHQTMSPVPQHVVEKFGNDWVKPEHYVVNGPYKLAEWIPNTSVKLIKNPSFYDAANVQIEVVYYYPISDTSIELQRYKAGELDFTSGIPSRQLPEAKATFGNQVHVLAYLGTAYSQINVQKTPFNDVRVRRALSLAVDREAITDQLLKAGQVPAYSLVPPGIANYPSHPELDFKGRSMEDRRAEAKKLLADAGFTAAHPLKFTYRYFDSVDDRRITVALQQMWKQIGAEVELLNSESKVQYDALRTQNFEVASAAWIADFNDAANFLFLFQSSSGAMNYSKYSNAGFDRLVDQTQVTADATARAQLLAQAEQLLLTDEPLIPEFFLSYRHLVKPYLKGYVDNPGNWHRTRYMSIDASVRAASGAN